MKENEETSHDDARRSITYFSLSLSFQAFLSGCFSIIHLIVVETLRS